MAVSCVLRTSAGGFLRGVRSTLRVTGGLRWHSSGENPAAVKPFNEIPGPGMVGAFSLLRGLNDGSVGEDDLYVKAARKYGLIYKFTVAGYPACVISDAVAVEDVFRNEGSLPVRGTYMEQNLAWVHNKQNLPDPLVFAHRETWKRLRAAMSKQVTPRRLSHFTPELCSITDEFCDHVTTRLRDKDGWVEDVYVDLQRWALISISKVVFNERMDVFSGSKEGEEFIKASVEFTRALGSIITVLPFYKIFPTKPYKEYVSTSNNMHRLGERLLQKHYDKIRDDIEKGTVDETVAVGLLDQWLIEGKLSEREAITQACDQLGAGVDTTSNTATFMLHELAKNPQIQDALYQEVMEVVGPTSPPTAEQLQKLQLVRNCVKETLRIHPQLRNLARETAHECIILGYKIPAGIPLITVPYLTSRDSKYFPQPETFDPYRWDKSNSQDIPVLASHPFGFGSRMCYGRRVAELELHTFLTRIIQRFRLSTDQKNLKLKMFTVLKPDEPVKIQFIDRAGQS